MSNLLRRGALRLVPLALPACLLGAASALAAPAPVELELLGRTAATGEATAEIAAYDPATKRVFATNAEGNALGVYDFSDPSSPTTLPSVDLSPYGAGPNGVAFSPRFGGILAVGVQNAAVDVAGTVEIFDAAGTHLKTFEAGPLPDMVTFAAGGDFLLAANEGEPADDGSVDPEGSVTVIDLRSGLDAATVRTAGFDGVPLEGPVRTFTPGSTVAEDLEPEYITTAGNRAWVSVQEANAIGVLDIAAAEFEVVRSLGFKDHGIAGNGIDATDDDDAPTIEPHPNVFGMYQPDAIASYTLELNEPLTAEERAAAIEKAIAEQVPGAVQRALASEETKAAIKQAKRKAAKKARKKAARRDLNRKQTKRLVKKAKRKAAKRVTDRVTAEATEQATQAAIASAPTTKLVPHTYVATANEGDARDWDFFGEEERAGDLTLDPSVFPAGSGDDGALGRLNVTTTLGDEGDDGDYEQLYAFGGRSMSLLDVNGQIVYDTGDELEQLSASLDPTNYNKDHSPGSAIDNRSDNKGPEPEAVATGVVGGRTYAFLGAERSGMIYAYDLSSTPGEAEFAGWINTRNDDRGPEGIAFVPAAESPSGAPMLLVTYEITGTVAAYAVAPAS